MFRRLLKPKLGCRFGRSMLVALCCGLSACASVPNNTDNPNQSAQITNHQRSLLALNNFTTTGGLSYWTDTENLTARFNWQQFDQQFQVKVQPPLGMAAITLSETGQGATLERGGALVMQGSSVSALLQQGLGLAVEVPMEQINLWIRGHAGDGQSLQYTEAGLLSALRYTDTQGISWKAKFPKYTKFEQLDVPALILAEGGPYNLRIVIKRWRSGTVAAQLKQMSSKPQRLTVPGG